MKFPRPVIVIALFVAILSIQFSVGCRAGSNARNQILAPALSLTSNGFEADVNAGVNTLPDSEQDSAFDVASMYFEAVRSGDVDRITTEARPLWPSVRGWAELGIRDMLASEKIGPLGVESRAERIQNIENALEKTTGAFGW